MNKQHIDEAADFLTVRTAPEYATAAMCAFKQGQFQKAEQCLQLAILQEPDNAQWQLELARLQRLHNPMLARKAFDTAQSLGSIDAELEAAALYAKAGTIEYLPPAALWHVDRLDIAVKLLFAQHHLSLLDGCKTDAESFYTRHIFHRTKGNEPGSLSKSSVEDYESSFKALIESIKSDGFKDEFAIPVNCQGKILNGAHRLAAALALQLEQVPVVRMPPPRKNWEWGMAWFLNQDFNPVEINQLIQLWANAHPDQIGLLIVEHAGSAIPPTLMIELAQRFPLLAWRDLHPAVAPSLLPSDISPLPTGSWRYVLVSGDVQELQNFSIRQNQQYAYLDCKVISGASSAAWISSLLDENILASWHPQRVPPADNASSIAMWTCYADK